MRYLSQALDKLDKMSHMCGLWPSSNNEIKDLLS